MEGRLMGLRSINSFADVYSGVQDINQRFETSDRQELANLIRTAEQDGTTGSEYGAYIFQAMDTLLKEHRSDVSEEERLYIQSILTVIDEQFRKVNRSVWDIWKPYDWNPLTD